MITGRPYQTKIVDESIRAFVELQKRTILLYLATGLGKTIIAALLAARWRAEGRGRVAFGAHRGEILQQTIDKFHQATSLSVGLEQAGAAVDRDRLPDVTVFSVQTMRGERLREFPPDAFSLVILDESHRAAADGYQEIIAYFSSARVVGLTATPMRTDNKHLSLTFSHVAAEYPIRAGIADGWLVPIRRRRCEIAGLDLSQVRGGADFTDEDLVKALDNDPLVDAVARQIVAGVTTRRTMVFTPGVRYGQRLAAAMNRVAGREMALAVDGSANVDERAAALASFRSGARQALVSCLLYTEGFDEPSVEAIAVARPTKSLGLFTQIVGRGLRLHPGKRDLLVLEIVGRTKPGQRLIDCLDVLGARDPAAVRHLAARMLARDPALDVSTALERAAAPRAVPGRPAAPRHADARENLLAFACRHLDGIVLASATPGAAPANAMQVGELARQGLDAPGLDVAQASTLLEGLRWRKARGLCSVKQAIVLHRLGYPPDCRSGEAGRLLSRLLRGGLAPRPRQASLPGVRR